LVLPAVARFPVLVIDDNADTLRLFERYVSGTRYHLAGVRHSDEAFGQLATFSPQIIVLDVMMPETDGWRVMGRLREHPATQGVPILVCTILAQEELALSLGASAFIQKPVTRQSFLTALDRLVASMETGPD
jgi:CheY-like chemotaxis protein